MVLLGRNTIKRDSRHSRIRGYWYGWHGKDWYRRLKRCGQTISIPAGRVARPSETTSRWMISKRASGISRTSSGFSKDLSKFSGIAVPYQSPSTLNDYLNANRLRRGQQAVQTLSDSLRWFLWLPTRIPAVQQRTLLVYCLSLEGPRKTFPGSPCRASSQSNGRGIRLWRKS